MAKFVVVRGKKVLWNLIIVVLVIFALVYIFKVDEGPEGENKDMPDLDDGMGQVVVVEPVTVRSIPTKYSEYKLERERMRSRQIELLQNIAYDVQTQGGRREEAQLQLQALIDRITRETEIENLLKAKGYLDALVLLDSQAVTVVVPVTLTRDEAARVGELVHRLTGLSMERITIVDETVGV